MNHLDIIRELTESSSKMVIVKAKLALTDFEILLF